MTTSRIYVVTDDDANKTFLIRAVSQAQAINHAANDRFKAVAAKPEDIVDHMEAGIKVQDATKPQGELPIGE